MPASESSSSNRSKPVKQYICYMCSKTFDSVETLDSHKRFEHNETGYSKPIAGVG
jgi:hypothetical protein